MQPEDGLVGRNSILNATRSILEQTGPEEALGAIEQLIALGLGSAQRSGISMPPFMGDILKSPAPPEGESRREWSRFYEERCEKMLAQRNDETSPLFPMLISALSGARGSLSIAPRYASSFGLLEDVNGKRTAVRSSLAEGMTADEMCVMAVGSRLGQARAAHDLDHVTRTLWERFRPAGLGVLERAMRAENPGVVFARAAAEGEVDPLAGVEARLFVGL